MIAKLAKSGLTFVGARTVFPESYKECRNKFKYKDKSCCINAAGQELVILFYNSTFYFNGL